MSPSTIKHGKKRTEADTAANEDEADDNGLDGADGRKKKNSKRRIPRDEIDVSTRKRNQREYEREREVVRKNL